MKETVRRLICLALVLCMGLSIPMTANAATLLPDSIYLDQEGTSTCTLCSTAMMIRARMYLNGNSQWSSVTESGIRSVAWINGMGLRWKFTYERNGDKITVSHADLDGISVSDLKAILDDHPEGIVLYCGYQPHAVFLTDYEGDTFYCADPTTDQSGKRIKLVDSWLGHGYGTQERILNNVTAYWYVSSYTTSGTGACDCSTKYSGNYRCTADGGLNIRSGHGTKYSAIGTVPYDALVTVAAASGTGSDDWAHITYNGVSGYVSMEYLELEKTDLEIVTQPESVTATAGSTVWMYVDAVGDGLTYQWQWIAADGDTWDETGVSGNTTDTITMEATDARNGNRYRCVITDRYGSSVISEPATLTVTDCGCSDAYAGEYVCTAMEGSYLNIRSGHGTDYSVSGSVPSGAVVTVTKASGTGSDDWAHITYNGTSGFVSMGYLKKQGADLRILTQPEDVTAVLGTTVSMSVEAEGEELSYQWQWIAPDGDAWDETGVSGNTTDTITMEVTDARNGNRYRCVVTDRHGNTVVSEPATLRVQECVCLAEYAGEYICTVNDSLNIRGGHGTGYPVVGSIPGGAVVTVTMASGTGSSDWAHITYNGISGYVSMGYLTKQSTPLEIIKQPVSVTVAEGEKAVVTVEAEGDGLTYAWYYKSATGSKFALTTSFTGPKYYITMTEARNGRQVYCVITDQYGNSVTTDTVMLSMEAPTTELKITKQPENVTVAAGEEAVVTVEAEGEGLTYAWYFKNPGSKKFTLTTTFAGNTYSVALAANRSGRQVYCVITDKYGNSVTTNTVTLTVGGKTELKITKQPEDVTVAAGEEAVVTVEAEGEGLTYAWYFKNPGSKKFTLTTTFTGNTYSVALSAKRSGRQVYCVITDKYGNSVTTDTVTLSTEAHRTELRIITQPKDVTVTEGEKAIVTVEAEGDGLTYQWYYKSMGGSKFNLTTSFSGPNYYVSMSGSRDGRQVYCVISDQYGNYVTTETVTLNMKK